MGLLIVGTAFLASLCISWWARTRSAPEPAAVPDPPTTTGVVGFPASVDALATLDAARGLTKRLELHGIALFGVRSDGTVDIGKPGHRIRYAFSSARGEGPQPPRPPGTLPSRQYCGRQNVHVRADGMQADPDQASASCPGIRAEALPTPRCGPKEVWKKALARGVKDDALASIEYFRSNAGPAWRFAAAGPQGSFVVYGDCERELTGSDAVGSVP